jgi:signal transduction histidine kinase
LLLVFVDNALKFTSSGGGVKIEGDSDATEVAISVADTGTGI